MREREGKGGRERGEGGGERRGREEREKVHVTTIKVLSRISLLSRSIYATMVTTYLTQTKRVLTVYDGTPNSYQEHNQRQQSMALRQY